MRRRKTLTLMFVAGAVVVGLAGWLPQRHLNHERTVDIDGEWVDMHGLPYIGDDFTARLQVEELPDGRLRFELGDYSWGYVGTSIFPAAVTATPAKLSGPPSFKNPRVLACNELPAEFLSPSFIRRMHESYGVTKLGLTYFAETQDDYPQAVAVKIDDARIEGYIGVARVQPRDGGNFELRPYSIEPIHLERVPFEVNEEAFEVWEGYRPVWIRVVAENGFRYYLVTDDYLASGALAYAADDSKSTFLTGQFPDHQCWYIVENPTWQRSKDG